MTDPISRLSRLHALASNPAHRLSILYDAPMQVPTTVREMIAGLAARTLTSEAILANCYDTIAQRENVVKAFLSLVPREQALAQAREIDRRRAAGEKLPPTAGIPIAIKDNIAVANMRATAGSKMLADYVSPFHATAVEKLLTAGLIVIGKTNTDEYGFGSSTENSAFGHTTNPHDPTRVPGGTSGGSAAAVAAGFVPWALGSDTGGSVRQPASLCGVVGLRPTYGRVSRYGLIAYASSMDTIGPIATTVEDAAMLLNIIEGRDDNDMTSRDFAQTQSPAQPRIAIVSEYLAPPCNVEVAAAVRSAADTARTVGASLTETSLATTQHALATYYIIACVEAASNLGRYDGVRYGHRAKDATSIDDMITRSRSEAFGSEAKRRIMLGTYAASAGYSDQYYRKACEVRRLIKQDFDRAFEHADFLLTPVSPSTAWKIGEKSTDPLAMYLADVLSVPASLAGVPAIVIPWGKDANGLPIGVQLTAQSGNDDALIAFARKLAQ